MEPAAPSEPALPRHLLVSPERLRMLMERTGTGAGISGRRLARDVGIPSATIDSLLNGVTRTQPAEVAQAIADRIGVDLLILWAPTGRAVPADGRTPPIAMSS